MLVRFILTWAVISTLTPAWSEERPVHVECDFDSVPEESFDTADELIRTVPEEVAAELFSEGRYYVQPGMLPDPMCPGILQALVIFEAPVSRVMELLSATQHQGEYLHHSDEMHPVLLSDEESIMHYELKILFTRLRYRLHYRFRPAVSRIWWQLDTEYDNDLEDVRGYWEFFSFAALDIDPDKAKGRTLAVYGTRVDVGAALPQRMQDALTRKKMRQSIRETRDWVNAQEAEQP
jgi:hypothetical protein